MNKYITEFVGTFFLVLTIGCTGIGAGAGVIAPLAIGAALMVMVFAGGHISGGHYNPAVTLGVLIRGKVKPADVVPYWIAQFVAAAIAALLTSKVLRAEIPVTAILPKTGPALLAEFLFTFALVYVVLNTATAEGTSGNSFYGLAIGMTVMTGAFAVGDISGGAFNPAVALGISVLGISSWSNIWIYLLADFAAAVVAAVIFQLINQPLQTTPIATDEPPYETPR
ncbi:MAG TPA: aquaporin [Candidatus Udaeobacter sp.]|jgi:aquaporin Z|nr:aquaporin [Candidatus Udaeobacter sp.]